MRRTILVSLLCVFMAGPAFADFQVWHTDVDPGLSMTIDSSGYDGTVLAGVNRLMIDGSTSLDGTGVEAFCIDVWDTIPAQGDNAMYNAVPLNQAPDPGAAPVGGMGLTKARHVAQLLDQWWGAAVVASSADVQAAALQLAVWEAVDELATNTYDVTTGQFSATGNSEAISMANQMLGLIDLDDTTVALDRYLALTNDTTSGIVGTYQDFVVKVPAPAALVLGLLGMSVAGLKLRKHA